MVSQQEKKKLSCRFSLGFLSFMTVVSPATRRLRGNLRSPFCAPWNAIYIQEAIINAINGRRKRENDPGGREIPTVDG